MKAQLAENERREQAAKDKAHWEEHEALKKYKADSERQKAEDAKEAIRTKNVNTILAGVDPQQRDDVALMLAGMQQAKTINLYDEAEDAGPKLRAKLEKDRPGWFKEAADAGPTGPQGAPGIGAPQGPLIGRGVEAVMSLTDEQFSARFIKGRGTHGAKL